MLHHMMSPTEIVQIVQLGRTTERCIEHMIEVAPRRRFHAPRLPAALVESSENATLLCRRTIGVNGGQPIQLGIDCERLPCLISRQRQRPCLVNGDGPDTGEKRKIV